MIISADFFILGFSGTTADEVKFREKTGKKYIYFYVTVSLFMFRNPWVGLTVTLRTT